MCLILFNVPITLKQLFDILSVCFFQVIWESIVNPRKLKLSNCDKLLVVILYLSWLFFLKTYILTFLNVMIIYLFSAIRLF